MSYYELQSETVKATAEFYSWRQILKRFLRLDFFNVSIKAYGHNLTKEWIRRNRYFLDYTWQLTYRAGRKVELAARKTAEDLREKLRLLNIESGREDSKAVLRGSANP